MAFSKARRLGDLITANAEQFITSAHITDTAITGSDIHSTFNLTGKTVTVATASAGDNDTSVASTAFVQQEIASLVDSAPGTLNTLNELAAALGDDANFSTTVTTSIADKLPLGGGTLTGNLTLSYAYPRINLTDTNHDSDYSIINNDGKFGIYDATNNEYRLHILANGNVGIGTTNPAQTLHVNGNAFVSGQTFLGDASGDTVTLTGALAHASDFTLDAGGNITLDADGGEILLKDGGTEVGRFLLNDNNHLKLKSIQSDADILLQGNDGGSGITALRLDMSAAGKATFNASVTAPQFLVSGNTSVQGIQIGQDASNSTNSGRLFFTESGGSWAIFNSNDSLSFNNGGTYGSSSGTQRAYLTAAGNLNIDGTFTAGSHINGGDGVELRLGDSQDIVFKHHASGYGHLENKTGTLYMDSETFTIRTDVDDLGTALSIDANQRVGINQTPAGTNFTLQVTGQVTDGTDARVAYFKGYGTHTSIGSTGPTLVIANANLTTNNYAKLSFESGNAGETVSINAQNIDHGNHYGDMAFNTRGSGGYSEKMRITSNGKVGIGTTSPATPLHVNTTVSESVVNFDSTQRYCQVDWKKSGTQKGAIWTDDTDENFTMYTPSGWDIDFWAGAARRIRIASGGALMIGTTTDVGTSGARVEIINVSSGGRLINTKDVGSGSCNHITFNNSNGQVGRITTSGSATAYVTSSDYRLKENIVYDWDAITKVKDLKPAQFNFKTNTDELIEGFIAHEAQSVVPYAVVGEKDGEEMQGIDQSKLVPLLTKAIQEQQTIIDDLKSRIETLEE